MYIWMCDCLFKTMTHAIDSACEDLLTLFIDIDRPFSAENKMSYLYP